MLITKRKAIAQLRTDAGFSIERAAREVANLATYADGKRLKVKQRDLQKIIDEANTPSPISMSNAKEFRQRHRQIMRMRARLGLVKAI